MKVHLKEKNINKETVNILVVDDDADIRQTCVNSLKRRGYKAEEASTSAEAISIVKDKYFNIAIIDIKLPDASGLDTLKNIKAVNEDTMAIMVTAFASLESSIEAMNQGAYSYLIKPVNMEEILFIVDKALEKQQLLAENKRLLQEFKTANEKLKKVDQLKSDFVSVVSHELRTPLAIIKEGVCLVRDGIVGPLNTNQKNMLNTTYANINRLSGIINDLLDISKIESGKVQLKKTLTDITELIHDTVEKWRLESCKKNQRIEIITPEDPVNVYIDIDKIIQVLNNLLSNAIKYTPEKGRIKVALADKREEVEISISDNGIGIPEEDLPKVFGKFQQFVRTAGSGVKGTGLGLAITKELIERHQGMVWVESKFGRGSKFSFSLPKMDSENVFKEHINNGIMEVNERGTSLSLITARILNFTHLQKDLGNDKSYNLLREVESRINQLLRRKADTVVRGTGELVVLLFDTDQDSSILVKGRIEELIKNFLTEIKEHLPREISFSIGYASYPQEAKTAEELLNRARGIIHV